MSNTPDKDDFSIRTGRIVNDEKIILLLEHDKMMNAGIPHTEVAISLKDKNWQRGSLKFNGICAVSLPEVAVEKFCICTIGDEGDFLEMNSGKTNAGKIENANGLASIDNINGEFVAVGILGKIFRKSVGSPWENISLNDAKINLESSCSYPKGGILVCGWEGGAAFVDDANKTSEIIETGTNVILTSICCDNNGEILICGQRGTILRGTKDNLNLLNIDVKEDFWSIVKFKGLIYVSSISGLYILNDDNSLKRVVFEGEVIPSTFYHLDNYKNTKLLSVGRQDAVFFDGDNWERIL